MVEVLNKLSPLDVYLGVATDLGLALSKLGVPYAESSSMVTDSTTLLVANTVRPVRNSIYQNILNR